MAIGGGFNDHGGGKSYPGEFTKAALWTSIAAACGGLIFGYDIGISGGVTSMPIFLEKFFPSVYHNQVLHDNNTNQYCKFNDQRLTIFTSSLYFAAIVSSCVASYVTRRWGRKPSMLAGGFFFLFGALINGFAQNLAMLYIGRALLGFGIGFANQSAPVYLSEMAPYKHRGACNMLFQLSITIGILAANLINFGTSYLGSIGWRISLGGAAVPALIFIACTSWLPDSPNSLIERGKEDEAREMLVKIRGTKDVDQEFNDLVAASNESKKITHPWRDLLTKRKHIPHLTLVTCIPAFQQLTGMNVIMFYAPVLFKTIGFGNVASLGSSVVTGLVNALATLVSIKTVDRLGRRHWFLEGGIQMFICQVIITLCIALKFGLNGDPGTLPLWYGAIVVIAICVYVAGFAWSWGPLGWLVPCEILPLEVRSAGQTVNVLVNMLFTFLIAECFLQMMCAMKFGLFIFFACFVVMMTVFIYYLCPETKGIPIEDMQDIFKNHPVWKNYVEQGDSGGDKKLPPV